MRSLEGSHAAGAKGLKIWKNLGLTATVGGRRLMPDDPVLGPVWDAAGDLRLPVLIHVADPVAFFQPMDRHNERLDELLAHPSISLSSHGGRCQAKDHRSARIRGGSALEDAVRGGPRGLLRGEPPLGVEDARHLPELLDRHLGALRARSPAPGGIIALIQKHQDRVLFGADVFPIDPDAYRVYFRLFETEDEYFRYSTLKSRVAEQGRWTISGLGLAPEILQKLYERECKTPFVMAQTGRG